MALPFFYKEDITAASEKIILDEDTSKHIVQVLRMQKGEQLQLTNGKGDLFTCTIADNNRKRCTVTIVEKSETKNLKSKISIAISLLKNNTRFEWFLEKATEIGVTEIIPLICERTEKTAFKFERMKSILVSAMLQSQQCWLPVLNEPTKFAALIKQPVEGQKFIAHCEENKKENLIDKIMQQKELNASKVLPTGKNLGWALICIGPEGDFTKQEIEMALQNDFTPVSLGNTRLRTETAGMVAAALLRLV